MEITIWFAIFILILFSFNLIPIVQSKVDENLVVIAVYIISLHFSEINFAFGCFRLFILQELLLCDYPHFHLNCSSHCLTVPT